MAEKSKPKLRIVKKMRVVINHALKEKLVQRQQKKVMDLMGEGWQLVGTVIGGTGGQRHTVHLKKSFRANA
jgi:hypothetical protein